MWGFHRSTGALIALLATTALAAPAWAQNAGSETQPNQRQSLDENGVNPATGQQINYTTELSIGPAGPGGLRLARGRGHGVGQSSMLYLLSGNPTTQLIASAGFRSITFNKVGSTFEAADGSAATLVQNSATQWTLTLDDGTIVVYKQQQAQDSYKARGTDVTYSTGEKLTLAYNSVVYCANTSEPCNSFGYATRLQSVSSSLGYQFHYTYGKDEILVPLNANGWKRLKTITALNTTIDPCDPFAGTCTTTQSWPTITIGASIDAVTDPVGNVTTYTDSTTQFKIKRPSSAVDNIIVNIDSVTQRTTSVVRDGMTWTYNFSLAGTVMTLTRTDPLSHVRTTVSDTTVGLPTSITDELNRVTAYQYDSKGQRTRTTFPEGNYIQYTYDARGNVTQVKRVAKAGSGQADIITSATYPSTCTNPNSCNNPVTTIDARGNVTDYSYDSNGNPLTITSPPPVLGGVRPQIRYAYANVTTPGGAVSQPQSVSRCQTLASCAGADDETKISYSWSNQLILTGVTQANGTGTLSAVTTITNDNVGNPKTIDGPLPGTADTTTLRHDNLRRQLGTISPDPDGAGPLKLRAVKTVYHSDGGVQTIQRGTVAGTTDADWAAMTVLETQTIGYDSASRPATVSIAGSDGVVQAMGQQSYDGESRPDCYAVRMNSAAFGSLPASACTLGTQGGFGPDRISKTIYDAADQVIQSQVAVGTADAANERTLTYLSNGQLQTLKDAENNLTTYIYDGHDRLAETHYPVLAKGANASSATDYEAPLYDAGSNVVYKRLRDGQVINFAYDNLNRVTLKDLPGAEPDVTYAYDNLNRLTSASQTGNALSFTYDALSRNLTQVGPQGTVASQWDLAGRRTRLTYPGSGLYIDYDYLVTAEMTAIRENGAVSGVGVLATFGYDDLGRRTKLTYGSGEWHDYAYDPVSRLASLTETIAGAANGEALTFTYNPASQIASTTRSNDLYAWTGHGSGSTASVANGLNQLTSIGGAATTHDTKGNLTTDPTTGKTYSYSSENLLTGSTGGTAASLTYDPAMRLYQLTGAATTRFAYDGTDMIAEYDGANAVTKRYVHGPGVDEPLVQYEGADTSTRRWLHADERGSVIAVSDGVGTLTTINRYDEYGKPQATNAGRFQYTGQMWLPELGLYYYKARMYAPHLPRFLQTDPVGIEGGMNLYAGMGGDPVNLVDPTGTDDVACTGTRICRGDGWGAPGVFAFIAGATTGPGTGLAQLWKVGEWDFGTGTWLNWHYEVRGWPGAPYYSASYAGNESDSQAQQRISRFLRTAVVAALGQACSCAIDASNIAELDWNAARVIDPSRLPNVFTKSLSGHASAASVSLGNGYVLKVYYNDKHYGGTTTITISTSNWDPYHYLNYPAWRFGDPINSMNARVYCSISKRC